jgi:hypothetical protein
MKKLISAAFGMCALALVAVGTGQPAQARSNVGVYIGPNGVALSVERYRRSCRDYWFRNRHPGLCARYYNDYSYYPGYSYRYGHRYYRDHDHNYGRYDHRYHRDRDHDHDRDHRW